MNLKALKRGDVVDIISPATACTQDEIAEIKKFVKKIGLLPRIFLEEKLTLKKPVSHEFPSFEAEQRFQQLKNSIENSESKIIWCARGGYGSADLLPFLQKMKKPKNQKIFIGFSDLVSLTTFLQQEWNWQVICSPMLTQIALNKVSKKSEKAILDLIFGKTKELKYKLEPLNNFTKTSTKTPINAEIAGGCISVLAGNFGTKNQIDWKDKILFLEDEGEDGERLDRYFNQIVTIMIEQKKYPQATFPQAILLGNFLEANPHGTPKAKNIKLAIEKFVERIYKNNLKISVFAEKAKCLGHSKNMMPLILGCKTTIKNNLLIQTL
jgi:muramoyltetrapeptide carboxypeptidase